MIQAVPDVAQLAQSINVMIAERKAELTVRPEPPPNNELLPVGIHFNLSSELYHASPAIGSSDIKKLLRSPTDYWWSSHMNPNRTDTSDSAAKLKGRALHCLVLEGEAAFEKAFAEEPSPANYPGALVTADDLKRRCRELSEGVSGVKAELAQRIRLKSPQTLIFDDVMATFKAMIERDGLEVLKPDAMADVRRSAVSISLNPHLKRGFEGGVPELSIFWVDQQGIPCKARFDYTKPRLILDLKRITNVGERPFEVAAMQAIAAYRYDISAEFYLQAYSELHRLADEGKVFGDCPLRAGWHERMASPDDMRFCWVFHQDTGAPVTRGFEVLRDSSALSRASREIAFAKRRYLESLDKFGREMWVDDAPITTLFDTDLPAWMRQATEEGETL